MSNNPFESILTELATIKEIISFPANSTPKDEIIGRKELMVRLEVSEPTVIRMEKRGSIPVIHIGGMVRYNWPAVVRALENPAKSKQTSK